MILLCENRLFYQGFLLQNRALKFAFFDMCSYYKDKYFTFSLNKNEKITSLIALNCLSVWFGDSCDGADVSTTTSTSAWTNI